MSVYQPPNNDTIPSLSVPTPPLEPPKPTLITAWVEANPEDRNAFARFVGPAKLWDLIEPLI
jgi:hypothetical protein